jgi:NAD-dependent dihydropyrimidine dehydrogenase PreA subunit
MINISKNKCVGCRICKSTCPEGIEILDGRARVKDQNADCLKKAIMVCPQGAIKEIKQNLLFAIGTDDNRTIKSDDDVGMSKYFQVWKYSDGNLAFQEKKENLKYREDETRIHGDPGKAEATTSVLTGIDVIVGKIYGPNIIRMRNKFVCAVIREPEIKKAIEIIKDNINEIVEEYNKKERTGIVLN